MERELSYKKSSLMVFYSPTNLAAAPVIEILKENRPYQPLAIAIAGSLNLLKKALLHPPIIFRKQFSNKFKG